MDRSPAKPGWNLTVWALAGFMLVAFGVYVAGGPGAGQIAVTTEASSP